MSANNTEDIYWLTPIQEAYFQDNENESHCRQLSFRIEGELDAERLEQAWQRVVQHHPVLRTMFLWKRVEQPLQVVRKQVVASLEKRDWSAVPDSDEQLQNLLREERDKGFDLSKAPLVRIVICRNSDASHQVVFSYHPLVMDQQGLALVVRELFAEYNGTNANRNGSAPTFGQYVAWLREHEDDTARDYWHTLLSGVTLPTSFGVDRISTVYPEPETTRSLRHSLSASTTARLRAVVEEKELTLEALVSGIWALLLSRYSREDDVVFGVTVPRPSAGLVVGPLSNTLPVRVKVDRKESLFAFVGSLQSQLANLDRYSYTSPAQIREWNELPPRSTLFENELAFGDEPALSLNGTLRVSDVRFQGEPTAPLSLRVLSGTELDIHINYETSRFHSETIARLATHFCNLLEAVAANPAQKLSEISMLDEAERRTLLDEWNETTTGYPSSTCVHKLFEAQAALAPDAVAAVYDDGQLTYAELNTRANKLAHHLMKLGVGPETPVGVCLERSVEMVVALLGILKAGGAYLPLDTSYPIERLSFMIQDSRLPVLVTQESLVDTLPSLTGFFVCVDEPEEAAVIGAESDQNPGHELSADNLAYIIYTSGSTGMPKGISITHRGVVRLVCNTNYIRIRPDDRIAQASNASFDAATFELWGALLHGATIIGISKDVSLSPRAFARRLREQEVTILFLTTALFNQMVMESPVCFAGLRYLLFGGEAVEPKWVRQVLKQGAPEHILHVYGPTESTTYATYHHFTEVHDKATTIPIGIPLANTTAYLLDKHLDVVPVGVPGELFVGGDGLARNYLQRPELTAEKFIPSPFGRVGERLYRTGDLACYMPDGSVVFIGRVDYQVKVRGFRIELEEIEAALSGYPAIKSVVVQAWEDEPGSRRLIAYLVCDGDMPTAGELRSYLSVKLPEYMIPAVFIKMESLPLTANGKVDRKALPAPDSVAIDSDAPFVAPRTLTEELIATSWSDLLRVPRVSRHDSFFELGGHSLLATQLISRLRELFSIELTLRTVFDSPMLADLAAAVDLVRFGSEAASAVPFERVERDGPLPLSFAQQRLWFLDQLEPGTALYNVPAAVRLRGQLEVETLQRTLTEVVRRHESLRTTFTLKGGEPRQVIAEAGEFPLQVVDFSGMAAEVAEAEALRVLGDEALRPFDLSMGPLLRVTLVRVAEMEHVVVLVMHHIISDGWSMGLLIGEVTRLYAAYASGGPVDQEDLSWQYADYAAWQRRRLGGAALEDELSYWREQLAGAPAVLELATDRPRTAAPSYRGATEAVELSPELTEGLRELSRKSGVTLFMTLLSGFQTLLWRYSGQRVVNVGTPVANRTRAEAEGIIGFFVNTLVMRAEIEGGMRVGELLRQVRETCLGAYGHQEAPFERVVEELQPERSLSHTPLFQVMFILQNTPQGNTIKLPDLELSMVDVVNKTSTFDLTFSMTEASDKLALAIEYSSDLFDAETIRRMAEHYQQLLTGMAAADAARLSQLPMLSEPERQMILDWNDTRAPFSSDKCAHQLFEDVAARQPDVVAVSHADEQMSYGELNARANQLAHYLMARGVGPDVLVGLMLERSIDSMIGLLAVLKAGGAYVPLDPNYPADRLAYTLEDSGARLLLTEKRFVEDFFVSNCEVVCIDDDREAIARESTANPERWLSPDQLAYVIYTSGSTGKPKGVMIAHRSLVNYIEAIISDWRVGPTDRLLQFASLSFDASAEEIYTCLLSGATLVLRTAEMLETPNSFLRECGKRGVTVLDLPVAYWNELTADSMAAWEEAPDVRLMIIGAEKPHPERVERWFERLGDRVRLINTYGPTEATIVATLGDLKPQERRRDGTLPEATIGRPPQNLQAFVLDKNLQLLPVGAAGELHIGGEGLARGYLQRGELTAEKFIPHPFSDRPGARLYKTGDLAKYLPDGNLEFVGRVDQQVKLRGFRIELGEIEVVLSQHEDIQESVVIVREDKPGDKRLVAYYTTKDGAAPKSSDVRNFLQERLPDYMVPSFFVPLDRLPLTTSNKVDRRALPAPDLSELAEEYVAPRTPAEETLADIWRNVLGLERVGVFDNFFQLGGHSLLITQIISRVREAFHVEVSLKVFFSGTPTVAMLAEFVEEAKFTQANDEEIDELLADLDALSDEAVRELLARESSPAYDI